MKATFEEYLARQHIDPSSLSQESERQWRIAYEQAEETRLDTGDVQVCAGAALANRLKDAGYIVCRGAD